MHLANYSFTDLHQVGGAERVQTALYRVDAASTPPPGGYFPEGALARWWAKEMAEERPVWCFPWYGVKPVTEAYAYLHETLHLDAVVVLDAGVDGLFIGNEHDLGTPAMDAVSILAAASLPCTRIFGITAFGTEGRAQSVRHADALHRMAELVGRGACLGVSAALPASSHPASQSPSPIPPAPPLPK